MRFKEYIKTIPIKEAVIDIPRQTYAPGVFDDADTKNPKLKPEINTNDYKGIYIR